MTEQQAQRLVQRAKQEVPQIRATVDDSRPGKDGMGYRVHFQLGLRVLFAHCIEEWTAIKHAWQYFYLPEEAWEVPQRKRPTRYLVDGIPMTITQGKDGYWRAMFTKNGTTSKKYLGKDDPRGRYPVLGDREVPR